MVNPPSQPRMGGGMAGLNSQPRIGGPMKPQLPGAFMQQNKI